MPRAVPNGMWIRLTNPSTRVNTRAQGCRSSKPQAAANPASALRNSSPATEDSNVWRKPCIGQAFSKRMEWPNRVFATMNTATAPIRLIAEAANQSTAQRCRGQATPPLGAGGTTATPTGLPQVQQNLWPGCNSVPQRSQNMYPSEALSLDTLLYAAQAR